MLRKFISKLDQSKLIRKLRFPTRKVAESRIVNLISKYCHSRELIGETHCSKKELHEYLNEKLCLLVKEKTDVKYAIVCTTLHQKDLSAVVDKYLKALNF